MKNSGYEFGCAPSDIEGRDAATRVLTLLPYANYET